MMNELNNTNSNDNNLNNVKETVLEQEQKQVMEPIISPPPENNINANENKKSSLRKKIIIEYILLLIVLIMEFGLPYFAKAIIPSGGLDTLANSLVIALALVAFKTVFAAGALIIYPIYILIKHRKDIKETSKKILKIILIIIPIIFGILITFERVIGDIHYNLKYNTGKNAYTLKENEYKSAKEFYDLLESKGFIYDSEQELLSMNFHIKYGKESRELNYFYTKPEIIVLPENGRYSDDKTYNDFISIDSTEKYPGYIYNALLYLDEEENELKYVNGSRFDEYKSISSRDVPYYRDYYIEVKFVYVDSDLYAIIGVGASYDAENIGDENDIYSFYNKPYTIILSEKETTTTYYEGKFYPDGGIENNGNGFEMRPNKNIPDYSIHKTFNVKKVDKLDVNTLNEYAKELKNGALKESIEKHIQEEKEKQKDIIKQQEDEPKLYETIKDKEINYTLHDNNIYRDITFLYYYQNIDLTYLNNETNEKYKTPGYKYIVKVMAGWTTLGEFVIGEGITKEEATNASVNNKRPTYDSSMVRIIKDKNDQYKYYFLLLVPEFTRDLYKGNQFIVTPTIFNDNNSIVNKIETAYNVNGYTYIKDSKYNLTEQNVLNNYASYYYDSNNNEIYFIDKMKCLENNNIVADIKKVTINNGNVTTTTFESNINAEAVGASC